ncbi:hypothetical protein AYI68_g7256 [Smittium mucronatum]|uniref:Uncharacterized protein n=1 Tax=Smittium mucronatum TaxID=133383 RepID=A0A1R0GP87_9FUNG|nr:hypothetical protein AYI68_g7256 [Smittium mucronatum]
MNIYTRQVLLPYSAYTVGITEEDLTGGLKPESNESKNKEDKRSPITGSPAKLIDRSKSSPSAGDSVEKGFEASLSLFSTTSCQASISGENTHR